MAQRGLSDSDVHIVGSVTQPEEPDSDFAGGVEVGHTLVERQRRLQEILCSSLDAIRGTLKYVDDVRGQSPKVTLVQLCERGNGTGSIRSTIAIILDDNPKAAFSFKHMLNGRLNMVTWDPTEQEGFRDGVVSWRSFVGVAGKERPTERIERMSLPAFVKKYFPRADLEVLSPADTDPGFTRVDEPSEEPQDEEEDQTPTSAVAGPTKKPSLLARLRAWNQRRILANRLAKQAKKAKSKKK